MRTLELKEKYLSPDHRKIATSLSNLGTCYLKQKKIEDALPLYTRAYEILKKSLSPDHIAIATSLNN